MRLNISVATEISDMTDAARRLGRGALLVLLSLALVFAAAAWASEDPAALDDIPPHAQGGADDPA